MVLKTTFLDEFQPKARNWRLYMKQRTQKSVQLPVSRLKYSQPRDGIAPLSLGPLDQRENKKMPYGHLTGKLYVGDSSTQVPFAGCVNWTMETSYHTNLEVIILSFQQSQFQNFKLHFSCSPNYFLYTSYFLSS